jgi:hypothetical protein
MNETKTLCLRRRHQPHTGAIFDIAPELLIYREFYETRYETVGPENSGAGAIRPIRQSPINPYGFDYLVIKCAELCSNPFRIGRHRV